MLLCGFYCFNFAHNRYVMFYLRSHHSSVCDSQKHLKIYINEFIIQIIILKKSTAQWCLRLIERMSSVEKEQCVFAIKCAFWFRVFLIYRHQLLISEVWWEFLVAKLFNIVSSLLQLSISLLKWFHHLLICRLCYV